MTLATFPPLTHVKAVVKSPSGAQESHNDTYDEKVECHARNEKTVDELLSLAFILHRENFPGATFN